MHSFLPQAHKLKLLLGLYFTAWFSYFAWFWSRALSVNEKGDLVAGQVNIWGDWAAHFTMGSALAYRDVWLSSSPFLLGAKFAYPFAANLLSAILIRLGMPFVAGFVVPSFIFSCLIVLALFWFYKVVFKSRTIAVIASLIFLLNGGMGFWYYLQDIHLSSTPVETALNPPHEYTRLDAQNIKWISVIDSMIIPQRAFNHGFPLALLALAWLYSDLAPATKKRSFKQELKLYGPACLLLGLLPFIHTHSFLAAGIILAGWSGGQLFELAWFKKSPFKETLKKWLLIAYLTAVIAVPLLKFFVIGQVDGFLQWYPGWLATEFKMNWLIFWWKNWGLTPWLAIAGWAWLMWTAQTKEKVIQAVYTFLPFFVLFSLANLFLFQPFSWDNTKLIAWASLGFAGLAGYALVKLWKTSWLLKPLAVILFAITIASGTIDAYWILRRDLHSFSMYSNEELELANWVKANTPVDAIWLTGDQHNHFLFNLTGRQAVMTYRGWLWTHGYHYLPTEADVSRLYQFPERTDLYQKYNIGYVVVGPNEREVWGAKDSVFNQTFEPVKTTPRYTIYEVK
jgi:hypothetical protein